jgi:hypothetical protein
MVFRLKSNMHCLGIGLSLAQRWIP